MPKRKKKAGGGGARRPALSAADRIARDIGALVLEQQANSSSNDEHDDGADLSTAADAGAGAACTPCKGPEQQGPCEPPATPSPPLPSPQRTLGLPNLHWNATPLSELRSSRHPRFMGLPKEEHVSLGCPHAFRFLRQDGQAWRQLHSGALTTGCLSDLLGLKEAAAAALLHMNKGMVGHHHQVAACENLRQQPDPRWHGRCSTGCSGDGQQHQQQYNGLMDNNRRGHVTPVAPASAAVAAGPCHAGCLAANLGAVEQVNAVAAAAGPRGSSRAAEWQLQHQQLLHDIAAAKAGPQGVRMAWGKTQEGSALAALTRLFPSSMLHEVGLMVPPLDALPAAPSGSVWVQQQRQTDSATPLQQPISATTTTSPLFGQATASFSSASSSASAPAPTQLPLPLLGASPDGIICHYVSGIPRHRADRLAATAAACHPAPSCHPPPTSFSSCISSSASFHCRCCCRGCGSGGGAEGGGLQNGHSGGGRAQKGQAQGGSCSSSGAAAAAVDPALMLNLRFSLLQAVDELLGRVEMNNGAREQRPGDGEERSEDGMSGMSGASSAELSTAEARGASSGGQLGTGSSAAATAAAAAMAAAAATAATGAQDSPRLRVRESVEHVFASACPVSVLQDNPACGQAADPPSAALAPPGPHPPPAAVEEGRRAIASAEGCHGQQQPQPEAPETCSVLIREVVEVKCCCPFACLEPHQPKRGGGHRRAGGGGGKRTWVVSDRGPYEAFAPAWVPQMQLHMLASGCWSGLLVSWSATKGMRVFRMRRDDEYLARMLSLVSRVYRSHVVPPANLYRNDAEHHAFLHHTLRLARAAKVVADVEADGLALQPRARPQDAFV